MWARNRRFALRTLKDFGFGRSGCEGVIQEEAELLCKFINESITSQGSDDDDFTVSTLFGIPVVNVLWRMVLSRRFERNDQFINSWIRGMNDVFKSNRFLHFSLPRLSELFPKLSGLDVRMNVFKSLYNGFERDVEEHKRALDLNTSEEPKDFVEAFLMEGRRRPHEFGNDRQLKESLLDLFLAGAETTSTTLKWGILFMAINKEAQEKCRREIFTQLGKESMVTSDFVKENLPYCT